MRHIAAILILPLCLTSSALADDITPLHSIAVAGQATLLVPADHATITVGVVTQGPSVAEALADNSARMARVVESLRALAVPDPDIKTAKFDIQPKYQPRAQGDYGDDTLRTIIGYSVSNQVDVTIRDMTKVSQIIDTSIRAGANAAGGIAFDVDNFDKYIDRARAAAVENAHHKAEVLSAASHLELGRALSVTDNEANRTYEGEPRSGGTVVVTASRMPTPILPGQVRIVAQVTVLYAVK